jgi:cytochrome c oxidase subunit II
MVHVKRYAFSPSEITLKKGETVKLVLVSDDVRHGLAVRGLGVRFNTLPDHPGEVIITPTETGEFPGTCSVYCGSSHRDMQFMVHVVE